MIYDSEPPRYFTYILTNKVKKVLYTGFTNDLNFRLQQHAEDAIGSKKTFAARHNCIYLLYYEEYRWIQQAIAREKEISGWSKAKKIALVKTKNPDMKLLNES